MKFENAANHGRWRTRQAWLRDWVMLECAVHCWARGQKLMPSHLNKPKFDWMCSPSTCSVYSQLCGVGEKVVVRICINFKIFVRPPHAKIISKHCISWNKAPIHCALSLIHRRRVLARWPLGGVNSFIYFRWSRDYDVSPSDPPTKGVFHLIWCVGCSNCAPHAQDFHPLANSLFCTKVMSSLFAVATSGTRQHSWTSSFCNCLVSYWRCCSPCSAFVWLFYTFLVAEKLNCI